jgi:hypothetical protein
MEARFLSKVDKNGDNGCWVWTGGKDRTGYGKVKIAGKTLRPHRVSYELYLGEIPDGLFVLHSCDNRPCVNPAHLSVGTHQQNMKERNERGRTAKGEGLRLLKLTEQDVREIKILLGFGFSVRELGKMYNVDFTLISCIKRNKIWKHVV